MKRAIATCALIATMGILGLSSLTANAGRDHYRWVDERGDPVHSDRPPPEGINYEVVSTGSNLIRQVTAEEGAVPAEIKPRVGNQFEQSNTQPAVTEKNPENCQRARDNLATLNSATRIRIRNEQGEYHYLTEEEKDVQRQKAQNAISAHCE